MEVRGLYIRLPGHSVKELLPYYTQLSNLAAAVSSVLLVIAGQTSPVAAFRYLSVCMLMMTVFVTTCVLIPMGMPPKEMLLKGNCLYHHTLCPAVSLISYLFFERHAGRPAIILPVLVTLVYGIIMLLLNAKGTVDGPYPFFRVKKQSKKATVLWFLALSAVIAAISAAVSLAAG